MNIIRRVRGGGTRRAGLALAGLLALGLAGATGTALAASSSASSASSASSGAAGMAAMADMASATGSHAASGFTNGWLDGKTVRFHYTKNFFCAAPPASKASSKCEAGADYTQTPSTGFDPLYVVVPLGFTPPASTLQCPVAGHCIDHPSTIDLSAVLGAGTADLPLPAHSHIVATNNGTRPEWWNVDVVGVKTLGAWKAIVGAKSDKELQYLQRHVPNQVTGNITTNLFLWFSVS
jgi:hypothetical protein